MWLLKQQNRDEISGKISTDLMTFSQSREICRNRLFFFPPPWTSGTIGKLSTSAISCAERNV